LRGEVKEDLAKPTAQPWERDEWDVAVGKVSKNKVSKVSEVSEVSKGKSMEVALFRMVREIESGAWWVEAGYD
jgi:hypothetical protein